MSYKSKISKTENVGLTNYAKVSGVLFVVGLITFLCLPILDGCYSDDGYALYKDIFRQLSSKSLYLDWWEHLLIIVFFISLPIFYLVGFTSLLRGRKNTYRTCLTAALTWALGLPMLVAHPRIVMGVGFYLSLVVLGIARILLIEAAGLGEENQA